MRAIGVTGSLAFSALLEIGEAVRAGARTRTYWFESRKKSALLKRFTMKLSMSWRGPDMMRSATLDDVAKAANLSPSTVSRHLNGSIHLPEETVRRIDSAIAALRYRPNPHARSLGRGRLHSGP